MRRRMVATGAAVLVALTVAVLAARAFPTAGDALTAKTIELPHELEHLMFLACLPGLYPGSGDASPNGGGVVAEQGFIFSSAGSDGALSVRIEAAGDWSVTVTRTGATMRNERPSADQAQMDTIASEAIPAAQSLYDCLAPYRFAARDAEPPSSRAQLLQLYRYDTAVLWPCLRSQGIEMGDPPSRDQFVSSFAALTANPLSAMTVTRKTLPRLATALRTCPLRPAYLG